MKRGILLLLYSVCFLLLICIPVKAQENIELTTEQYTAGNGKITAKLEFINHSGGAADVFLGMITTDGAGRVTAIGGSQTVLMPGEKRMYSCVLPVTDGYKIRAVAWPSVYEPVDILTTQPQYLYGILNASLENYQQELKSLMQQCGQRGISIDYEQLALSVIERFSGYIDEDIRNGKTGRADYTAGELREIYHTAKDDLKAYLDGEKEAKKTARYQTGNIRIDGKTVYASAKENEVQKELPMFFVGYGHFEEARRDIAQFGQFGANIIQMETGPGYVVRKTSGIADWIDGGNMGGVEASFERSTSYQSSGIAALKIENRTAQQDNCYKSIQQYIKVKPNTAYRWGFKAKSRQQSGTWISANGFDMGQRKRLPNGSYDWMEYDYRFTTDANQTTAQFVILTEDEVEALYLDDMYIMEEGTSENLLKNSGFEIEEGINEEFDFLEHEMWELQDALAEAEKNNVSVCFLLSPHYFTEYLTEQYPEIKYTGDGTFTFILDHPQAKKMLSFYVENVMKSIRDYQSLSSICLTNEPRFCTNQAAYYQPMWIQYLKDLYKNDIINLNSRYQSAYQAFEEVAMPQNYQEKTPLFYDYITFNNQVLAQFHRFLAEEVKKYVPEIPVHTKMESYAASQDNVRWNYKLGCNYELYTDFLDINGNDAGNELINPQTGEMSKGRLTKSLWYDMQTGMKTAPVYNSEDHIILDGEPSVKGHDRFAGTDVWQGALHGRIMSTYWVWDRREDLDYIEGSLLFRPDVVYEIGKNALDLNRLNEEVYSLINRQGDVGILYSSNTRLFQNAYLNMLYQVYEGTLFAGFKADIVPESNAEKMKDYKTLLVPMCENITNGTFAQLETFARNGGKIIVFGSDSFKYDEYGKERDAKKVSALLGQCSVHEVSADGVWVTEPETAQISSILREEAAVKMDLVRLIDTVTGEPVTDVEYMTGTYQGTTFVNIANYDWNQEKHVKLYYQGKEILKAVDLKENKTLEGEILVKPYEPIFLTF